MGPISPPPFPSSLTPAVLDYLAPPLMRLSLPCLSTLSLSTWEIAFIQDAAPWSSIYYLKPFLTRFPAPPPTCKGQRMPRLLGHAYTPSQACSPELCWPSHNCVSTRLWLLMASTQPSPWHVEGSQEVFGEWRNEYNCNFSVLVTRNDASERRQPCGNAGLKL